MASPFLPWQFLTDDDLERLRPLLTDNAISVLKDLDQDHWIDVSRYMDPSKDPYFTAAISKVLGHLLTESLVKESASKTRLEVSDVRDSWDQLLKEACWRRTAELKANELRRQAPVRLKRISPFDSILKKVWRAPAAAGAAEIGVRREILLYIWAFVQPMIIIKTAIVYYGIEASRTESRQDFWIMVALVAFSFGSLLYFGFSRYFRDERAERQKR